MILLDSSGRRAVETEEEEIPEPANLKDEEKEKMPEEEKNKKPEKPKKSKKEDDEEVSPDDIPF